MLLSDLAERLELSTRHSLQSVRIVPLSGLVAELGTLLPNGEQALISLHWTFLELKQNGDKQLVDLIQARCQVADAALDRYVESFQPVPAPQWDGTAWAD